MDVPTPLYKTTLTLRKQRRHFENRFIVVLFLKRHRDYITKILWFDKIFRRS